MLCPNTDPFVGKRVLQFIVLKPRVTSLSHGFPLDFLYFFSIEILISAEGHVVGIHLRVSCFVLKYLSHEFSSCYVL